MKSTEDHLDYVYVAVVLTIIINLMYLWSIDKKNKKMYNIILN